MYHPKPFPSVAPLRGGIALALLLGAAAAEARQEITCNVAIVGGGPGGVHTAYQLAQLPKDNPDSDVCLFEKEDQLGGRIHDEALDPAHPDWVFGEGALRVMEGQAYLFKLASDLGIGLEAQPFQDDLISARGFFGFNSDALNKRAYPKVADDPGMENALYDKLRFGPERANIAQYPDLRAYVQTVAGSQGYRFLADMFRFRADFTANLDARGYLDYFDEEWDVCCTPSYPVGGMSQFVLRMADVARQHGARIYTAQPVQVIKGGQADPARYLALTPGYKVKAKKLIIAAPKVAVDHIQGDIPDALRKQGQFQDLVGIPVATIAQRWPSEWWKQSGYRGKNIHRAWTTDHCLNFIEIPTAQYAAQQKVTRSVYTDDLQCVRFWEHTAELGQAAVEKEIMRGLKELFPKATIPEPLATKVRIWPDAWYWLRGGSQFTNAQIAQWAVEPLPGEQVSLVGESYNPQRSGWSDGAYKSSINALNAKYGFSIAIPAASADAAPGKGAANPPRSSR